MHHVELESRSIQNFKSWRHVWHLISDECRLNSEYPVRDMFKLFACAICQIDLESGQGISIHEGLSKPGKLRPWDGPFLCHSCQEKKEAMEGKRHSRGINSPISIYINCCSSISCSLPNPGGGALVTNQTVISLHLQIPRQEIAGQVNSDWSQEPSWGNHPAVWQELILLLVVILAALPLLHGLPLDSDSVGRCHAYICWSYTVLNCRANSIAFGTTPASSAAAGLVAVAHVGSNDTRWPIVM